MLRLLHKFRDLAPWEKRVLISAWFLLAWKRALILTTDFKRQVKGLEHHREPPRPDELPLEQLQRALSIGRLVAVAARYTPWNSSCLAQVLVTQHLLQRRGIAGYFCLGVKKNELASSPEALAAHAWLSSGGKIINGAAGHEHYTVVSAFSWGFR